MSSGGFHNSSVDSPGKKNTRSKYSSFSSVVVSSAPVAHVAPAINATVLYQHPTHGGYYNRPMESPGKVSTRVKYSSILSNAGYPAAPVACLAPVVIHNSAYVSYSYAAIEAHAHPTQGGYYNRPMESPGKCSSRAKYSSIMRSSAAHATGSSAPAAKSANQLSSNQAQIDAVKKQYASPPQLLLFACLTVFACMAAPTRASCRCEQSAITRSYLA
jgi:hypothetical protein